MFPTCSHGYIAVTCPSCRGASAPSQAPAPAPVVSQMPEGTSHYSGASDVARQELADLWPQIMARASSRLEHSMAHEDPRYFLSPAAAKAKAEREGVAFA